MNDQRLLFIASIALVACGGNTGAETEHPLASTQATTIAKPPVPPASDTSAPAPAISSAPAVASVAPPAPPAPPPECPEGMVKVPGGKIEIGYQKRKSDVHDVCVAKTEVTAAQYAECVKAGKCGDFFMSCGQGATYQVPGKENYPIVCVDFKQAKSYCEYKGQRLPTEEEWEWVARGGDEGRKYAWGNDDPKDQACWAGSAAGDKAPCEVGSHPSGNSALGISDLTGNVFEWTTSKADPAGAQLICRGGSWKDGVASALTVARVGGFKAEYKCGFGGMRCFAEPLH